MRWGVFVLEILLLAVFEENAVRAASPLLPTDCGAGWPVKHSRVTRIVHGQKASEIPWQVALLDGADKSYLCGGSVISDRHVITAAQCFYNYKNKTWRSPKELFVRVGDHNKKVEEPNEKDVEILEIKQHLEYSKKNQHNDIALVVLAEPLTFNSNVFPICVPSVLPNDSTKKTCLVSGWGKTETEDCSDILMSAKVNLIEEKQCKDAYSDNKLTSKMICAGDFKNGGPDSCRGDSGGPLACEEDGRYYLYGVTSWGKGCGQKRNPGVYTNVASYREWIEQQLQ